MRFPLLPRLLRFFGGHAMRNALADRTVALVVLQLIAVLRLWDPLPIEAVRLRLFDSFQSAWPRVVTARPVSIVDIDEPSLATIGQWPWPRTLLAQMVERLAKLGAAAVVFDVVFPEPDRASPASVARSLPQLPDAARLALQALPDNDEAFAAALQKTRVILGETALSAANAGGAAAPARGFALVGPSPLAYLPTFPALLGNLPTLQDKAAGHGLFTLVPERDGVVRRAPMILAIGDRIVPSLTLETLRVLAGSQSVLIRSDPAGVSGLAVRGFAIATDANGQIWIHFSRHDPEKYVSARDLLSGAALRERIANKIVLIGTSALGLVDNKTTPSERSMPGVEVHAQILESVLSRRSLREIPHALATEMVIALCLGLLIIVLAPLIGPLPLLLLGAMVTGLLFGVAVFNYRQNAILFDASFPLISSWAVYSTLVFLNYFRERSGRRSIRRAFSQYMSPVLVEQLAAAPEKLRLGGERRRMTIMFSDVRGFTTISEGFKEDPQGLTSLMNRLLTPLTNAIISNKGTIDKYMGDAIMAFWGAPLDDPRQELNACLAALEMLARLKTLNAEREQEAHGAALPPIDIGVGVNTGECVVGNMGSDLRFDYSVLGDPVNFASRIEGQSKAYGVKIMLGDATARAVQDVLPVLQVDLLVVKGKSEAQPVWALLGGPERCGPEFEALREAHESFLAFYRRGGFRKAEEAIGACEAAARGFGLQPLYALYRRRLETFRDAPPAEGWTGVFVAQDK